MTDYDYLIVGHGIAGATLAHELRQRGRRVLVYDTPRPDSASNVAAGLMNPVAGKRFALTWRADELLPFAASYYRGLEQHFGQQYFFPLPIFKLFGSKEEQREMLGRPADGPWGRYVAARTATDPGLPGVLAPHGGAWLRGGGHVLVRELLAALATEGEAAGWLRRTPFDWARLVPGPGGSTYAGQLRAREVVCCEGAAAVHNPFFTWLPLTPNQGEVLNVDCPGLADGQVLNRGAYVVPVPGAAGQFRVGATYSWPPFAPGPTDAGRAELAGRLAGLTALPFVVREAQAGIRPAVRDRRPLLGRHPTVPGLSFCGGYGSKGVMLAPRLARLLADHLEGNGELWPEADLARYAALCAAGEA